MLDWKECYNCKEEHADQLVIALLIYLIPNIIKNFHMLMIREENEIAEFLQRLKVWGYIVHLINSINCLLNTT